MERKIRLSQCMIVKNEEKNIRRALSWGKDILWEQIVVDTGSTDRTAALAKEMGAKVFYFSWIDDFAAAKNFAIDQASGDWIAFLDADEYFSPEDVKKLLPILEELDREGFYAASARWVQVDGSEEALSETTGAGLNWQFTVKADGSRGISLAGTQIRLFRNMPGLRYRGRVHEKLYLSEERLIGADKSRELSILHTGYTPEELEEKNKAERNILLVKKELEDHPEDYKLMTYLGDSYFQQKKYKEAAVWYQKAARRLPENEKKDELMGALIFKHLLVIYTDFSGKAQADDSGKAQADEGSFGKFKEKDLVKTYKEAIRRFPKEADFDFLMGRYCAGHCRYREAAGYLQKALGQLERYGSDGISVLLARSLLEAWDLLVLCHYENGDLEACVSSAVTLLKADPWRKETLTTMLKAFKADEARRKEAASPAQVLGFLQNFYDFGSRETAKFVLEAAQEAGYAF